MPATDLTLNNDREANEKCGVFGVITPKTIPMGQLLFFGLNALQHRGQESCGMAVFDNDQLSLHKGLGLVSRVFTDSIVEKLHGQVGVGHTRYATTGETTQENSQPVVCRSRAGSLVLAHNGNLFNLSTLRDTFGLEASDGYGANSDSHVMARCIAQAMAAAQGNLQEACKAVFEVCEGAFSVVVASGDTLVAARDRHGIRPLCVGKTTTGHLIVASETCALDIVGAQYLRDILPGEVFMANRNGETASLYLEGHKKERFCVFEYVYFARPDSMLHQQQIYEVRLRLGHQLALRQPVEADMVIPVPDSGNPAAVGYSRASGIPYMEGLIKNRYVGRTFINPTQELREQGLRMKLNPLSSLLKGKRVVVVDDSIVRGSTSQRLVAMLRHCEVKEIHLRISSAPVKHPCFYGIDMSTEEELLANQMELEAIRTWLGVDTLAYLTLEDMTIATKQGEGDLCTACFNNVYPAGQPSLDAEPEYASKSC
jgi:amidophosphoribosyltransferase